MPPPVLARLTCPSSIRQLGRKRKVSRIQSARGGWNRSTSFTTRVSLLLPLLVVVVVVLSISLFGEVVDVVFFASQARTSSAVRGPHLGYVHIILRGGMVRKKMRRFSPPKNVIVRELIIRGEDGGRNTLLFRSTLESSLFLRHKL